MDEKTVTMMEGVAREWRVRVMDSAGNVLNPEGFSFYGAAADGVQVPRRMQVRVEGDVVVLVLPGLWMSGRCWRYQVMCQDVLTGVEWVLCQGDVVLERRVACNGPALHEDAVLVDAVLDSELEQVEVFLGDSTAACAEAARLAVAARAGADEAAARAAVDAARVEELKGVTLDVAAGAALAAERAEAAADNAANQAENAETYMHTAATHATAAKGSELSAATHATAAAKGAQDAETAKAGAEQAAKDAAQAQVAARQHEQNAAAASQNATQKAKEATVSASQAAADKAATEQAKTEAQAAQSGAEEQAAIAMQAAADAQAPESIAAQAARPATMLLVRDELMSVLGDSSRFDLDTDGQKIIVHTDRLDDEQLAAVTDMLGRFVPGFIEVVRYNHSLKISWREVRPEIPPEFSAKYDACKDYVDMAAVDANYKNDLVDGDLWAWPLSALTRTDTGNSHGVFSSSRAKHIDICIPACTDLIDFCQAAQNLETFRADCSHITRTQDTFWSTPKLRHVNATFDSLVDGHYMFGSSQLDKESMLRILYSLPAYTSGTHRLRIASHVDNKTDDDVLAAISNAEEKGWTMTVEWNPDGGKYNTPASTTYGFRKPPIYARLDEIERPDGTTEQRLDWGHYVSHPENYEEFSSVEAAREYFGLAEESEE